MNVKLTWYGDSLIDAIRAANDDALFEGARILAERAAERAPVRTGALRDSAYAAGGGQSTYRGGRGYRKEIKPPAGTAVAAFASPYAHLVEFGTVRMAARPFLRPALNEAADEIGGRIAIVLGRDLKGKV